MRLAARLARLEKRAAPPEACAACGATGPIRLTATFDNAKAPSRGCPRCGRGAVLIATFDPLARASPLLDAAGPGYLRK